MAKTINNYQIISKIASGGMSEVYLAQDINTGTKVALKILDAKLSIDPEYLGRFKKEASICKQLDHENIVKIISYGTFNESYYIAYEYIEGITLDKYIKKQSLTVSQIENISVQILKALSYAHTKNIIHRDIKPSNIIIEGQTVKILDFGIAKQQLAATVTRSGLFMGSPHYVSPEQIEGHDIDNRSDIYSFGIVLYEMIEGTVPFSADTPWGIIRAHLDKKEPEITKDVPAYLKEIVSKCLAKKRQDRFKSADEVISVIESKEEIGKKTVIREWRDIKDSTDAIVKATKRNLSLKVKLAITLPLIFIAIWFLIGGIFNAFGSKLFDEGRYLDAALKYKIARILLVPNAEYNMNYSLDKIYTLIINLLNEGKYADVVDNTNLLKESFPDYEKINEVASLLEEQYEIIAATTAETAATVTEETTAVVTTTEVTYKTTTTTTSTVDYEKIRKQDLAEEGFLDKMYSLLDEYSSVSNHINTYGGKNLTFGEPNTIEFEGSVFVKYQELASKLRNFSCPSSYEDDKSNLIGIAETICVHQNEVVNNNKNNNYDGYITSFYACNQKISDLFNYYNRMVDIHNKKYH